MASHPHALVAPNEDMTRLAPALAWLMVMLQVQDGSWPPKVEVEHVLQSMLDVVEGSLANLTYGRLASIDTGRFVARLNFLAQTKVPRDFRQGLEGFFKVWDQALQCDRCSLLSIEVNRDSKGVTLISEPRRCSFAQCSGTFRVIKKPLTEIRGWADGKTYPFTDRLHRVHDSDYPLHDDDLKDGEWHLDKRLLGALADAGVSIGHFLRYCVVTQALHHSCGVSQAVRGIWDYLTKGDPMAPAPLINPIIERAKHWKEEEAKPKDEEGAVQGSIGECLPEFIVTVPQAWDLVRLGKRSSRRLTPREKLDFSKAIGSAMSQARVSMEDLALELDADSLVCSNRESWIDLVSKVEVGVSKVCGGDGTRAVQCLIKVALSKAPYNIDLMTWQSRLV